MLQISDLTFDNWGRRFFDGASVTLQPGMKAGLVGRNGAGKSTLFKLILGELQPLGGDIVMPKAWRVATVDQEIAASPTLLIDSVLALDVRRARLMAEVETAPPERQGELHADLAAIDADRAPSRAAEILSGLGFANADLTRPDQRVLRRLAHARDACRRAAGRARPAAARRTDQLPGPGGRALAGGATEALSERRAGDQPRP
jgi:ATP-binding cassette subfamily F protein 3